MSLSMGGSVDMKSEDVADILNDTPEITNITVILGTHFEACESCKKMYFSEMEKITMKVVKHIKEMT